MLRDEVTNIFSKKQTLESPKLVLVNQYTLCTAIQLHKHLK